MIKTKIALNIFNLQTTSTSSIGELKISIAANYKKHFLIIKGDIFKI